MGKRSWLSRMVDTIVALWQLDDTLSKAELYKIQNNRKSKIYKNLLKTKKKLDSKALRTPKTKPQWRDRHNWERVQSILVKRYGH